jgi:hypothetical protein
MKDRYTLYTEPNGDQWISAPMNGGDVGDLSDIVEELNALYDKNKAYKKIIESYEKRLGFDKLESCD